VSRLFENLTGPAETFESVEAGGPGACPTDNVNCSYSIGRKVIQALLSSPGNKPYLTLMVKPDGIQALAVYIFVDAAVAVPANAQVARQLRSAFGILFEISIRGCLR
jgi:hypothetical protein